MYKKRKENDEQYDIVLKGTSYNKKAYSGHRRGKMHVCAYVDEQFFNVNLQIQNKMSVTLLVAINLLINLKVKPLNPT